MRTISLLLLSSCQAHKNHISTAVFYWLAHENDILFIVIFSRQAHENDILFIAIFSLQAHENDIKEIQDQKMSSLVWICTTAHASSRVTVIDANNPADVLESFHVTSSHILCIASVPGECTAQDTIANMVQHRCQNITWADWGKLPLNFTCPLALPLAPPLY